MFPTLPSWSGMHPLVVHFPIALLVVAPLLVALGLALRNGRRAYLTSALALMAVGTIATYVAVATGEAGEGAAEKVAAAGALLERHEELAEMTRTIFTVLTGLFAALVFVPALLKRELRGPAFFAAHALFLALYLGGVAVLANAAHLGGRLVHEAGVHAEVVPGQPGASPAARGAVDERRGAEDHDDDD